MTGAAPAVRAAYACRNCSPGGPEAFFLFPSLCLARRGGQAGDMLPVRRWDGRRFVALPKVRVTH